MNSKGEITTDIHSTTSKLMKKSLEIATYMMFIYHDRDMGTFHFSLTWLLGYQPLVMNNSGETKWYVSNRSHVDSIDRKVQDTSPHACGVSKVHLA